MADMLLFLQVISGNFTSLSLFILVVIGLLVGRVLSVVIYFLPIMLKQGWRREAIICLGLSNNSALDHFPYHSAWSPSTCSKWCDCTSTAHWYDNLPLLSGFWLKRQARCCQNKINYHYPLIELLTLLISLIIGWRFSIGWPLFSGLIISWLLITLAFIDLDNLLLPDQLTLLLLWLGLLFNLFNTFTTLENAVIGAVAGYLFLWSLYWLFKLISGKEGMGYGDFKLLAALGACFGWQSLPMLVLLSSLLGVMVTLICRSIDQQALSKPLPFGSYLAVSGWLILIVPELVLVGSG